MSSPYEIIDPLLKQFQDETGLPMQLEFKECEVRLFRMGNNTVAVGVPKGNEITLAIWGEHPPEQITIRAKDLYKKLHELLVQLLPTK